MGSLSFAFYLGALLVALFTSSACAQQKQKAPAAATFYLDQTETQFSLSLANDSSDVFIYFASPAYSWVAVGFGESMENSLMLVMYANAKGDNITISPRLSTGHSEPSFAPSINLDILNGTGIHDDMYVLRAVCHSCRVWPNAFLDTTSPAAPMLFAFGPGTATLSDDPAAPLRRHVRFGTFTMDMRAALTADAGVPEANPQLRNAAITRMAKDRDGKDLAHAVLGCIALFVLWPLNVVLAAFFRNIKLHVGASLTILLFLVISFALGIATSPQYNRSKTYTTPHQLLAFVALLPTLLTAVLPAPAFKPLKDKIPTLHTALATLTFTLLVLSGGLGLHLAQTPNPLVLSYVAIALFVAAFTTVVLLCVRRRGSAYARATLRRRLGEEEEADLGRARWGVRKKLSRESEGSWEGGGMGQGHARSESQGSFVVGRGTMPGPQYLMNMHPGVPVYVNGQK
ncbi:iron reductase domain protein [Karstenula rhodostoma CBS 690.94]|uniref:Iron reductase domain protein n=1 Tax=Karstenula rhodostoma CBS 690.94 TaxID=1392251 RepID=A0A9P4P6N6_9PLEO|nr:iron reductase domain protein [Karstenula rhodostoma CBS 690.94]